MAGLPKTSVIKAIGYLISSVSVALLAIVAWDGVKEKPMLLACLAFGAALSIAGMAIRFASHLIDHKGEA